MNEDANNPSCGQCSTRKIICEPPALGMLGDVYDLCAILEWAGKFWSRRETLYWNSSFRLAVSEASKELCLRFEHAEISHRRFHMLSGIDWDDPSEEQNADVDNYRRFLAERRVSLDIFATPLTRTIDRQDWVIYNPERLLRLWKGDAGFLEWSEAKTEFLDHILRKSISIYGGEGSNPGRQRQVSIEDTFPVTVD
ncbi:hypothetical protein N7491_008093 [Penicillium cf. griseofulvum]|uniref:Uncharacterized protein n=1 Tax=Penicillium cf. griseofulvum TaxID=2972120 RepID=A0A9W9M5V4_9EURO|nr:hypothetical protein N7472_008878 [Penicillium cf. griseofulvum]KAJ5427651.1 hypothetical protein N7491_008093 [Penicillium cf. griseofulvum]